MTRLLRPTTLIPVIAGFLLAVVLDVVVNAVVGVGGALLTAVFILAALFGLLALWIGQRSQNTRVTIEPIPLDNPASRLIHARRGLIAFVSLYSPLEDAALSQTDLQTAALRLAAAETSNYDALNLEQSNLATLIATITAHASKLEHCWLITTTTGDPSTSSSSYAPVLMAFLQQRKGLHVQYHAGPQYTIRIDRDDALITNQTRTLVNKIYEEARSLALPEEAIVADFSGGTRSMMLGMILACLKRGRDIQFAGTRYDAHAKPSGEIFPILFNFEAELDREV